MPRGSVTTAHNRLQSRGAQMLSVIKRSKAIKISKLLNCLSPQNCSVAYALSPFLKSLKPTSPLPTPHSLMHSSGAPPGSRGFGVEPSLALGGVPTARPLGSVRDPDGSGLVGVSVAQATLGSGRDPDGPRLRREREGLRG